MVQGLTCKAQLQFLIFNFKKKPGSCSGGRILIPHHRQYLLVIGNINLPVLKLQSTTVTLLIILASFNSCAWFDQSDYEKIVGDYEVGWSDGVGNRSISKPIKACSGCYEVLVGGYVYAIGHNDSFIIAKQHSGSDTLTTYYYVIDIKKNEKHGGRIGVYESLNKSEFDILRNRLGISHIPFDMNYPETP